MLKKKLITPIVLMLMVIIFNFSCKSKKQNTAKIEDFIPADSEFVLSINSLEVFKSSLKNNSLLSKSNLFSFFETKFISIDSLKISGPLIVCSKQIEDRNIYTLIAKQKDIEFNNLSKKSYIKDSIWIINSEFKVNDKTKSESEHLFTKLKNIIDPDATFSVYFNPKEVQNNDNIFFENVFLNVNVKPSSLSFSGLYTDSKFNNLFKNINPNKSQISKIAPSQNVKSYVFSDFEKFFTNIKETDSTLVPSELAKTFLNTTQEIGCIKTSNGIIVALHSLDIDRSIDALSEQQEALKVFRSTPIFKFSDDSIFEKSFGSIIPTIKASYYSILDDFIVFSESEDSMEDIISKFSNKNTLSENQDYKNIQEVLSDEVSYHQTFDSELLATTLNKLFGCSFETSDLKDYQNSSFQLVKDDDIVHLNVLIQKYRSEVNLQKVSEIFSINLDAPIIGEIQFINNHKTKQKDILIQDVKNNLYLISNEGVIRWKKRISGAILGKVTQVDLFKNGNLQMSFATENRVYILDLLGKDIGNFPLKFKDNISLPLAVYDYDKNRNYRFLVTQGKNLLMYDGKGQRVNGFKYKPEEEIKFTPKHIRYRNKDYIVFYYGKKMKILNRRGKTRIQVKEDIDFSGQDLFFYKNMFSTLNSKGNLVQVDFKGRVSRQALGFGSGAKIKASNKTLVTQWDNILQIQNNKLSLEYGDFSMPNLFYLNDKIYITITDLQSNKIWFFDSNGNIFPDFPIYGTSNVELANVDKDDSLEFICKSSPEGLIMYQLY